MRQANKKIILNDQLIGTYQEPFVVCFNTTKEEVVGAFYLHDPHKVEKF
jgi:hypothetical protein